MDSEDPILAFVTRVFCSSFREYVEEAVSDHGTLTRRPGRADRPTGPARLAQRENFVAAAVVGRACMLSQGCATGVPRGQQRSLLFL
jgi:hypothetical protein